MKKKKQKCSSKNFAIDYFKHTFQMSLRDYHKYLTDNPNKLKSENLEKIFDNMDTVYSHKFFFNECRNNSKSLQVM